MKYVVLLLLSLPGWHWLGHIRAYNEAVALARASYQRGQAATAVQAYGRALAANPGEAAREPGLLLNLAQAQVRAGQVAAAKATYGQLLSGSGVAPALGSTARQQLAVLVAGQGYYVQALSLLRQALLLDPGNTTARYNYEVLRDFLGQQPAPQLPPPALEPPPQKPDSLPAKPPTTPPPSSAADKDKTATQSQPAPRPGTDRRGEADVPRPGAASNPPQPRDAPAGKPDPTRPGLAPGTRAPGGFRPGPGERQALPTGAAGGNQRGLAEAPPGRAARPAGQRSPGTAPATDADVQLQTQRERLRQLNLTPAQARQVLDALRAQEEQYLQQRPHPAGKPPRKGEPTW